MIEYYLCGPDPFLDSKKITMKARPLERWGGCLVNACRGRLPQFLSWINIQVSRQKPGQLLLCILSGVLELSLLYPSKQALQ